MQTHMEASTAFRLGRHAPGKPLHEQQIDTNMMAEFGMKKMNGNGIELVTRV